MTDSLEAIVKQSQVKQKAPPREFCLQGVRQFALETRAAIQLRHSQGISGSDVVADLSQMADRILHAVFSFALADIPGSRSLRTRVSLCALGGYGRAQMNPCSDLDISLVYEGTLNDQIGALDEYLVPFLWDAGFRVGFAVRSMDESLELARRDTAVLTSLLEGRHVVGDSTVFGRLKLLLREQMRGPSLETFVEQKLFDRTAGLPPQYRDLYTAEPNIKENAGGLRDYHTALWLLMMLYDVNTLEEAVSQGLLTADEHLDFVKGLDFLLRVRNEMHFSAGKPQDDLLFANQRRICEAFGYSEESTVNLSGLMSDYYASAAKLRQLLNVAARICHQQSVASFSPRREDVIPEVEVREGALYVGGGDPYWYAHNPARLMETFWQCARHMATLSRPAERLVRANLHLVNAAFCSSDLVRRFFVAICNRPMQAGHALRQAARCGFLARYLPEFGEIENMIRDQDFHSYPVGEHTLRAIEALSRIDDLDGSIRSCLREALEHLTDPYILVMALLFHDLGKAFGDVHIEESVRLTRLICNRVGMPEDDEERIAFLVRHHVLMTNLSQYRDTGDEGIVESFSDTIKNEQRLRALFLLSYADLRAVGAGVWTEWKGALLMQLYLRTVQRLLGPAEAVGQEFWTSPKAKRVLALLAPEKEQDALEHMRGLGQRYLAAFRPQEIVAHLDYVKEGKEKGLAMATSTNDMAGMTGIVICTQDRPGLFSQIAGSFASQLVDIQTAALFTRPDGYVIDSFMVEDMRRGAPLTPAQIDSIKDVLRRVLLEFEDVQDYVNNSRRRLFALLQPRVPVKTRIEFDNQSSRTHTVIDIETGDRTGLLYDITRAMAKLNLNISTARIVTDARRVRDSFYVTRDNKRVEDPEEQEAIREEIHHAIHPRSSMDAKGETR
ncbi:MAG TPA: [protein-PII] uridylyltransferase [Candidatus Hydrogenedentes bacterium]|nr:[protein-PII] uridylyltransferase [Candidatus Hydrogenedentota bacterium]HQM47909.1 [protein-PII] uridylyltransferase [Candidatus Hydrogenedentota bacterium]